MAQISVSIEEAPKKHTDLPCGYDEVFVSLVDDDLQCSISNRLYEIQFSLDVVIDFPKIA